MQCLGLTSDYHRCPLETIDSAVFCRKHQPVALLIPTARVGSDDGNHVSRWIVRFRRSSIPPVPDPARYAVPSALESSPTANLIERLLHDPDSTIRWCAAFVLRKRRDPTAVEPLWHVLLHDVSRLTRQQCAVALGKIGAPAVLGPLLESLWHDPDAGVRQAAAIALGNLGYPSAAPDLARALSREENSMVRWDIILALGQLGDHTVEPLLEQLADAEQAQFIRAACREALETIHRRQSIPHS
ncbi:MAG: HEAT repeat domain-containing protein [Anaerolineae bacterium]